jgi:hypothetical protein
MALTMTSARKLSRTLGIGFKRNQVTNNLPGNKNIDKVENQEPKAYQEFFKFVIPVIEPGISGLISWFNQNLLGCTNMQDLRNHGTQEPKP